MGKKIQEYFLYFMCYSVIGWCYEVFLEVAVYRWGFSNRGVLFGPYCTIYGFGALLLIFSLKGLKRKKVLFGKDTGHAVSGIWRNRIDHHRCGAGRQLSYGMAVRKLDVGLYPVCLEF